MRLVPKTATNIDQYIQRFPADVQQRLQQMRMTIKQAARGATETISYGIPAFRLQRMLVWFAAFKNHIGFYPGADGRVPHVSPLLRDLGSA